MRPRLSAGDRLWVKVKGKIGVQGFNEAPAERRGSATQIKKRTLATKASMRPRLSAGDRASIVCFAASVTGSFNEAPAERRGSGAWTR